jgi:threonine/homoserine/homoserine lactone efflux protein
VNVGTERLDGSVRGFFVHSGTGKGVLVLTTATTAAAGVVFGLAIAAPPGPMNAIIAEESVLRGWTAGFRAGLGAMTADVCFFVLASVGVVAFIERAPVVRGAALAVGGLLMLVFASGAVRDARDSSAGESRPSTPDGSGSDGDVDDGNGFNGDDLGNGGDRDGDGKGFRKAFVLALTNPYQIVFWLTVGVSLLEPGRLDVLADVPVAGSDLAGRLVVSTGSPLLLIGFFTGIVCWILGYPATLVAVGERIDAFGPLVAYASAAVLCGFGLVFLADGLGTLAALA